MKERKREKVKKDRERRKKKYLFKLCSVHTRSSSCQPFSELSTYFSELGEMVILTSGRDESHRWKKKVHTRCATASRRVVRIRWEKRAGNFPTGETRAREGGM